MMLAYHVMILYSLQMVLLQKVQHMGAMINPLLYQKSWVVVGHCGRIWQNNLMISVIQKYSMITYLKKVGSCQRQPL